MDLFHVYALQQICQVSNLIDFNILNETVKVVTMKELLDIFPKMLKGQTSGRIVVDVNK